MINPQNKQNLFFIPMKTPLPAQYTRDLGTNWTPLVALEKAKKLVSLSDPIIHTINVANNHCSLSEDVWGNIGASHSRISVPKEYDEESINNFCEDVNSNLEKADTHPLICLVYSGCGLNRVGFCISSYLTKECGYQLKDALKRVDESSPRLIFKQKPLDVLGKYFNVDPPTHGSAPQWINEDEKVGPIGEIPLPLEKYNAIKKISKQPATEEETAEVFRLIYDAIGIANTPEEHTFLSPNVTQWNSHSLDSIRSKPHFCTFEPRGVRTMLVITGEEMVFLVDSTYNVTLIKARASCVMPAILNCILIEEKKRAVLLTTDLILAGEKKGIGMELNERLAYLSNEITNKIKSEVNDQYSLQFIYRPMAKITNASKLKKDLPNLFVKCDGMSFLDAAGLPGQFIFLPIAPSVILQFDYNGNDRSVLYACREKSLEPVGVYRSSNTKFNGLDGRTNRFEFNIDKHEWNPVAVGHNDKPSTVDEVHSMKSFLTTNIVFSDLFAEFDQVAYDEK